MGSKTYDFLTESFLFDESLISENFQSIPENQILNELEDYRQFCLSMSSELQDEILSNTSNLKIFSGINQVDINLLKQSAFYTHQHILSDPLFPLSETRTADSKVFSKFLGVGESDFSKTELTRILAYLKTLTPMVAANYVKLLPTSYFFEAPKEVPFTYSETAFSERVPESLLKFFHDNAIVWTGKKDDQGIHFDGTLEIGRIISIHFKDHGFAEPSRYVLNEMEILERDKESGLAKVRMTLPDNPPDKAKFEAWVMQSINQTAGHVYYRALIENSFSSNFGASYLTNSPFIFELLKQIVPVNDDIQSNSVNAVLNMDLPFLQDVDIDVLMRIRSDEGEAFESFRTELDKQLRDLRQITDPETLQKKMEDVVHELSEVQVRELTRKLTGLKKKFIAEAGILAGSLSGVVQTGGWTLPVALMAAFQGYKSFVEYRTQTKENPAFFLWKTLRESKKSR
jgi:hypothetical protein